jgi:multidrug efflux pump subunit AcrA (membrane-fusion protein)
LDVIRQKPKRRRMPLLIAGVGAALLATSIGASRLRPAAPEVEGATLWIDTVRRGPMLRAVSGSGTLVPESQRIVSALTAGRVEQVNVRAGAPVEPGTILVVLSNPDVQLAALDAERQLKLAEAELAGLETSLENAKLAQQAAVATAKSSLREAERALAAAERLAAEGLSSTMEVERARDAAVEARIRHEAEQRRLTLAEQSLSAQLSLRRADVVRLAAIARFERERVASMKVTAGAKGVVQELSLDPGQWLQSGQLVARVAASDRLKAVLRVPEGQARDVTFGLPVVVDTRDGKVNGRVSRVDPAVQNGTIAVDVTFEGPLPRGARPDLTVDGTIEIERLANVTFVGRPAAGASGSLAHLFRLEPGGRAAVRVPVRLGRESASTIEVVSGLAPGDRIILSEMSQWDHVNRVRLR